MQAGIGLAGFGAGFLTLMSDDGPGATARTAICSGACARLRRSNAAPAMQTEGSTFELFTDEVVEPGAPGRQLGALRLSADGNAAKAGYTPGGWARASELTNREWQPLTTPAADAPGIVKKENARPGPSFDVPDVTPMCGSLVCGVPPTPWIPDAAAVEGGMGPVEGGPNVYNDLTTVNGTIVNPEPGTIVLTLLGLGALAAARRRTAGRA